MLRILILETASVPLRLIDISMFPRAENSSTLFNRRQNSIDFSHHFLFWYLLIFNYKVLQIHCLTLRSADHHFKKSGMKNASSTNQHYYLPLPLHLRPKQHHRRVVGKTVKKNLRQRNLSWKREEGVRMVER